MKRKLLSVLIATLLVASLCAPLALAADDILIAPKPVTVEDSYTGLVALGAPKAILQGHETDNSAIGWASSDYYIPEQASLFTTAQFVAAKYLVLEFENAPAADFELAIQSNAEGWGWNNETLSDVSGKKIVDIELASLTFWAGFAATTAPFVSQYGDNQSEFFIHGLTSASGLGSVKAYFASAKAAPPVVDPTPVDPVTPDVTDPSIWDDASVWAYTALDNAKTAGITLSGINASATSYKAKATVADFAAALSLAGVKNAVKDPSAGLGILRYNAATVIAKALKDAKVPALATVTAGKYLDFSDAKALVFYKSSIDVVASLKIMNGVGSNRWGAVDNITYEELIVIAYKVKTLLDAAAITPAA
ncbi:hypothetical protein FACS18949_08120 [Clostridia bacterium]|nr:hypothetical protein FACS18949_08120 [Clostridia bacterium]